MSNEKISVNSISLCQHFIHELQCGKKIKLIVEGDTGLADMFSID